MFIILGADGHVGSACAIALLDAGEAVTVALHREANVATWQKRGATTAILDICDVDALRRLFSTGQRAFLLNPPADVSLDTDVEEHRTLDCIVRALDGSGLEKIVLESTYGAQPGKRCGDLSVLYDFEQALAQRPIPVTVQRAAYYMSNWDGLLDAANKGDLPTMFPADAVIPMVAPVDLGLAAARRLREPGTRCDVHFVEGPARYTPQDVADAFALALGRSVSVSTIPREQWIESYKNLGFSDAAADAYARMTAVGLDSGFPATDEVERGETSLKAYVSQMVEASKQAAED